jgi:acyl-CoA synthetase (AMP-forming)/AMP-acid ligase II
VTDVAVTECLPDIVRRWSVTTPGRPALIDGDRIVSYAEFDARSNRIANWILAAGIGSGSHIGYVGQNSATFFEVWMGANKAGCAITPLNWRSSRAELAELVDDAELTLLFVGRGFDELVDGAIEAAGAQPMVIAEANVEDWLAGADIADPRVHVHVDGTALLAYTSGTTAAPKGVVISHRAFAEWFRAAADEPAASCTNDDVGLMVMPNFHLAGTWVSLPVLHAGASLVVLPAFEPEAFSAAVQAHRVTVTCLVPTAVERLLGYISAKRAHDLASLRRILYAGSPISPDTLRTAIKILGCDLVQFYGTTETFIITLLRPDQHRLDKPELLASCGAPMPGVQVRLVDAAGGDVADGEPGEVLVRSPWMSSGYRKQSAATRIDGWYQTGDVGIREHGNFRLVDRLKDMIVTGGENVYSAEVERALLSHSGVAAAAVIGQPDADWGERVVAFVVPVAARLQIGELVSHCRERIAGYKVPKRVHFVEALPLTASGKVRKESLRKLLRAVDSTERTDVGTSVRSATAEEKP